MLANKSRYNKLFEVFILMMPLHFSALPTVIRHAAFSGLALQLKCDYISFILSHFHYTIHRYKKIQGPKPEFTDTKNLCTYAWAECNCQNDLVNNVLQQHQFFTTHRFDLGGPPRYINSCPSLFGKRLAFLVLILLSIQETSHHPRSNN